MDVEVALVSIHDRRLCIVVRYDIDVPSWLYEIDVTEDLLVWVALDAVLRHFLSVSYQWSHVAKHPLNCCLPVFLIVFIFNLLHDLFLSVCNTIFL